MTDKTFIEITNRDIYDELLEIKKHVMTTNGRVKVNRWIASTSLTLVLLIIAVTIKS